MTKTETLLTCLAEECPETAQRISKALRFSLGEIQDGQEYSNAERIVYEFNDIVAVMEMLKEEGAIDKVIDKEAIELKKKKLNKWLDYSSKMGTMDSACCFSCSNWRNTSSDRGECKFFNIYTIEKFHCSEYARK